MRHQGFGIVVAAACPLALASFALAADRSLVGRSLSVLPEIANEGLTAEQSAEVQVGVANWLVSERPAGVTGRPVRVSITRDEIDSIEQPEATFAAPLKVGVVIPIPAPLALNGLVDPKTGLLGRNRGVAGGQVTRTPGDDYVWAVNIGSEGAGGIRLHIENLSLPHNAELYFYSRGGEAYGPFTGMGPENTGEFWTPSIVGDEGTLQLRMNAPVARDDLARVSLNVTEVGHVSRSFFGVSGTGEASESTVASFCSFNASCIQNNSCTSDPAVNNAELAVAKMLWVKGCCIYTCSGALIADSDTGTQIPYFMTANHCLSTSSSNLEAFFRYQVSCGTSTCTATFTDPPNSLIAGKTVGATIKATGSAGDFSLFQLSQTPPAGSVFLGWDNTPIANTNGAVLHRVSHPSGAPQAYSRGAVSTSAPTCQGWPRGNRIYSRDDIGGTEGGSSGSPVVNSAGQFVGQLTGACGTNLNNVCDHANNATVDGAFEFYYNSVAPFLAGGGGGCAPAGASCTANSNCCSNSCKGSPGNKTCR